VAVDSSGSVKKGGISAPTRDEAISRIESRGLQVQEVTEVDKDASPPVSKAATKHLNGESPNLSDDNLLQLDPTPHSHSRDKSVDRLWLILQQRAPVLSLFTSLSALVVAVVALAIGVLRNPLGRGISSYDFTTPEAAAKSLVQIDKNQDFRARLELSELKEGRSGEEMSRTFEIHKTADFNDKKILFVSYANKGKKIKKIDSFEKDPETKLWIPTYVSEIEVRKVNEQLAKEMSAWRTTD
jgi:hypothetical protein